jgi:hypothetical protein
LNKNSLIFEKKNKILDLLTEKKVLLEKMTAAAKNDNDSDISILLESFGV